MYPSTPPTPGYPLWIDTLFQRLDDNNDGVIDNVDLLMVAQRGGMDFSYQPHALIASQATDLLLKITDRLLNKDANGQTTDTRTGWVTKLNLLAIANQILPATFFASVGQERVINTAVMRDVLWVYLQQQKMGLECPTDPAALHIDVLQAVLASFIQGRLRVFMGTLPAEVSYAWTKMAGYVLTGAVATCITRQQFDAFFANPQPEFAQEHLAALIYRLVTVNASDEDNRAYIAGYMRDRGINVADPEWYYRTLVYLVQYIQTDSIDDNSLQEYLRQGAVDYQGVWLFALKVKEMMSRGFELWDSLAKAQASSPTSPGDSGLWWKIALGILGALALVALLYFAFRRDLPSPPKKLRK